MSKQAVVIYGPPGSGKGTQAELLESKYSFIHFDTGKYIESLVHDPELRKNSLIKREKKLFDSGTLNTPAWVLSIVKDATIKIARAGYSIIFSGSPRTLFEALGDRSHGGLLAALINLFGRRNITILKLSVRPQTSIKRNSSRLVCSVCGLPILAASKIKNCALCGAPARKRIFDNPKLIKVRLKQYEDRTLPIIQKAKKLGLKVVQINGEPAPYKVHASVIRALKLK
ncbi:MAG: Adenylate kinase [Candidatus Jorgensenbacteria bacterium GW2011_GWA1_48_13]|uniref:Adenylate kinase n=2 Tax=Candidatus Joergenseniibacteriota TaxID=1752739 RepID=A0A0G1YJ01_9BACT|nr:MAG: Adenylate kinase [Candidatus Jorgensenbacteria bacterium GW2011_GWA1_48_13]KKU99293.1 MAG: Adenylate kinase [Candidatus Jorgensenbacteria bacterium GW2011_GWC1_48_8]KKW14972.1 MAG: Adenylate kinase [Candidatus Jorgensenbacteria bacterium GW2011_GWB1_50_10]